MSEILKICPSIRDIFFQSDFSSRTTSEYDELDKQFIEKLTAAVPQFDKNGEIIDLATGCCLEARAMGFEEGFAFAIKLLMK